MNLTLDELKKRDWIHSLVFEQIIEDVAKKYSNDYKSCDWDEYIVDSDENGFIIAMPKTDNRYFINQDSLIHKYEQIKPISSRLYSTIVYAYSIITQTNALNHAKESSDRAFLNDIIALKEYLFKHLKSILQTDELEEFYKIVDPIQVKKVLALRIV